MADMIQTLSDVQKNQTLMDLRSLACRNGVVADFFEFCPDNPGNRLSEIYFIVCPDPDTLLALKRNQGYLMDLLEDDRHRSKSTINCYYNIVKVSDLNAYNAFSKHNDMCRAIQDISVLKNCFYECGYHLPKAVHRQTVDNLYSLQEKRNSPTLPQRLRSRYDDVLKAAVADAYNMYSKFEKHPDVKTIPFQPHRVHADYFIKNHIQTTYETVSKGFYEYLKSRLDEEPSFIYYKEAAPSLYLKDESKSKNLNEENYWSDLKEVCEYNVGFPTCQEEIFYRWMIDYNCRNYQQRIDYTQLTKSTSTPVYIEVDQKDMWNFNSLCSSNGGPGGIKFAVNTGEVLPITSESVGKLTLIMRKEDSKTINAILNRLSQERRGFSPTNSKQKQLANDNRPRKIINPYIKDKYIGELSF